MSEEKTVLGIDPGTNLLGYCILKGVKNKLNIPTCGVLHLRSKESHFNKLHTIYREISLLIAEYNPSEMAIEAPFFGKNVQSMLKLGRAQGAAIIAGIENKLSVHEYSPRSIKQAITGNGNSSKEQVARMLFSMYEIKLETKHLDETDAIAVAVCHYFGQRELKTDAGAKQYKNWTDFVRNQTGK